jgi:hypothetical protein
MYQYGQMAPTGILGNTVAAYKYQQQGTHMSYVRQGSFLPGTTVNITTSGSSQASGAVGNTTAIVRVAVTENTYVAVGTGNVTATANSMVIPAGGVEFLAVQPSTGNVAVLQVSTAGIASITQLAELP